MCFQSFIFSFRGHNLFILIVKVYQQKALEDKERYKTEMESYRERMKSGQVVSDAVPLQQRLPELDLDKTDEMEGVNSPVTLEDESGSDESDAEDDREDSDPEEASPGSGGAVHVDNLGLDGATAEVPQAIGDAANEVVDVNKEALGESPTYN